MNKELVDRMVRISFIFMEAGREKRSSRTLTVFTDIPSEIDEGVNAFVVLHEVTNATYIVREDYIIS